MPADSRFFMRPPALSVDEDALSASNSTKFEFSLLLIGSAEARLQATKFCNDMIYHQYLQGARSQQITRTMAPYKKLCEQYQLPHLSDAISAEISRLWPPIQPTGTRLSTRSSDR
ncbi:MAG: hypothetical protein NTW08_05710 [Gammaproteobacteria bacterium]|nr:hypothetical protein [Gammaproteobacteria bacterium]